ncbi:helix-turn-helix domain-containing protein [Desulforamulus aeronauticus]|uniref:helix-turn-helix domain-containing protein n=1 Tax=Desulforamulus aeronauticus TaxID=53343 RepID=UPI000933823D|nr:helix-turn-helix transcriptional regulator [Desulforamulus aeronauticus]
MKSLRDLRGNRTLKEVAATIGISKSYLSLIEKGERRMSLDIAEKLSSVYKVGVDVILHAYRIYRPSTKLGTATG